MIEHVEFHSEGAMLRGLLLRPESGAEAPVVIMAHGTSATIHMVADEYAEVFRRNGMAVLLYDHRNFGASEGEPRQEINPWIQCRGYLDAIAFVQTVDGIDHDRIGLWGDSYSAGEVMVVGAIDERVTAIVAQIPVCGDRPIALGLQFERSRHQAGRVGRGAVPDARRRDRSTRAALRNLNRPDSDPISPRVRPLRAAIGGRPGSRARL